MCIRDSSIVAYSNDIKENVLGISRKLIERYGAVSEEVVEKMAYHIRKKFKSDIGISTSGIAGPSGGTKEKPVGTVWIGYSDKNKTVSKKLNLVKIYKQLSIQLQPSRLVNGSSGRTRTCDQLINSQLLYQLSYRGI